MKESNTLAARPGTTARMPIPFETANLIALPIGVWKAEPNLTRILLTRSVISASVDWPIERIHCRNSWHSGESRIAERRSTSTASIDGMNPGNSDISTTRPKDWRSGCGAKRSRRKPRRSPKRGHALSINCSAPLVVRSATMLRISAADFAGDSASETASTICLLCGCGVSTVGRLGLGTRCARRERLNQETSTAGVESFGAFDYSLPGLSCAHSSDLAAGFWFASLELLRRLWREVNAGLAEQKLLDLLGETRAGSEQQTELFEGGDGL